MKSQKYILFITSCVSVLTLVLAIVFHSNGKEFETSILIGVFSSSFLAMLISIIEYVNKRRTTMEKFYTEALNALHVINQYRTDLELNVAIERVLSIFNYDYGDLDTAYGAMSFIFFDKRNRKYIFTSIYEPICQLRRDLVEVCHHLSLYKDGVSNNERVAKEMVDKATQLLMNIDKFENKITDNDMVRLEYARNKFYSPIEKELKGRYWNIMYLNCKNKAS